MSKLPPLPKLKKNCRPEHCRNPLRMAPAERDVLNREPIRTYEENGVTVRVFAPAMAGGVGVQRSLNVGEW